MADRWPYRVIGSDPAHLETDLNRLDDDGFDVPFVVPVAGRHDGPTTAFIVITHDRLSEVQRERRDAAIEAERREPT